MTKTTCLLAAALFAIGCGKKSSDDSAGAAAGPDPASSELTLDKEKLTAAEPAEACAQIYRKLDSCRDAFNRRVTAVTALDLGPDDAHAQAWVIEPMTASASAGLCKDDEFAGLVRDQIDKCFSNDCDELAACMMPGTAHELACPSGTRTMVRKRDERFIAWCVKRDGTPHGPMIAIRDDELRVSGQFENGARTGTWRWPDRGSEVTYQAGKPTAHNGTPVAQLTDTAEIGYRLLAMNVVGPEAVLAKGPIKAAPMNVLQGEDLFESCTDDVATRLKYAEGQVRVSFTITPDRKASDVTVDTFDPTLASCWKEKLLALDYSGDYGDSVADTDALDVRAAWGIRSAP